MRVSCSIGLAIAAVAALAGCGDASTGNRDAGSAPTAVAQLADEPGDCRSCDPSASLRSLRLREHGDALVVTIRLDSPPRDGDVLWVWRADAPMAAARFQRTGGTWRASTPAQTARMPSTPTGRHTTVEFELEHAADEHGIAITTGDGDRVPDAGWVRIDAGKLDTTQVRGDAARRSERRIAQAQQGMERLDPLEQLLGIHLLARQLVTGTFTYEGAIAGERARMVIVMDAVGQRWRQDQLDRTKHGWKLRTSLIDNAREERVCSFRATRRHERCVIDLLDDEPATQLLAMQHGARLVHVRRAPTRLVLGGRATCLTIVASVPDGPPTGERCALGDGTLASFDYVDPPIDLTLVKRRSDVDEQAFRMPAN